MAASDDPHRDLAGVLHDVSNALTVLLGWAAEARAIEAAGGDVAYALGVIEQRAQLARDLARHAIGDAVEGGREELVAVLDEVTSALEVEAARARVTLRVCEVERRSAARLAEGLGPRIDGALDLSQVVTNLVLNALAYAPSGSEITVAFETEHDSCVVYVTDAGPGVEPARRERIFEGDSRRRGGTGIGLRHSRAITRAHGGELDVVEVGGRLARFRLRWPRVDVVPRAPVSAARVHDLDGLRVLVVEDDPAVTGLLEASLVARGAVTSVATNRDELDRALAREPFDGVLVDLSPIEADLSGALKGMRAALPLATIVLITGNADIVEESLVAESIELVRKPFEVHEVASALLRRRVTKAVDDGHKEE